MKKILCLAIALVLFGCAEKSDSEPAPEPNTEITTSNTSETTGTTEKESIVFTSSAGSKVTLYNLAPGATISSPLEISGMVPNNWQFEATVPITIIADDGTVIKEWYGTATWIDEDGNFIEGPIEFVSNLEFAVIEPGIPDSGVIRIEKNIVSEEDDTEDYVEIPVKWETVAIADEEEEETGADPVGSIPRGLSHVEAGINNYTSCLAAGMETVIVGQNETSVCTTTDGRKFYLKIPGIWAKEDIPSVTEYMACIMGGLPVDRSDPQNPVCFMPDGRILQQN